MRLLCFGPWCAAVHVAAALRLIAVSETSSQKEMATRLALHKAQGRASLCWRVICEATWHYGQRVVATIYYVIVISWFLLGITTHTSGASVGLNGTMNSISCTSSINHQEIHQSERSRTATSRACAVSLVTCPEDVPQSAVCTELFCRRW